MNTITTATKTRQRGRRRGHHLEILLSRLLKQLAARGIHGHKNHARRTTDGLFLEGEPFDYEIFTQNGVHCFDAKECAGKRWSLKNVRPQQLESLTQCAEAGAEAYFLVLFHNTNNLVRFDALDVRDALACGRKSMAQEEGTKWQLKL